MNNIPVSEAMVTKSARALCAHDSEVCGTNADDNWALYSEAFRVQAAIALQALGQTYSLADIRSGTGFARGSRFVITTVGEPE